MQKIKRLLLLASILALAAFVVLCTKSGYPHHRFRAFILLTLAWAPLTAAWYLNRRLLRVNARIVRKKTRPWMPYMIVACILAVFFYIANVLAPVQESPLAGMSDGELSASIKEDLSNYLVLRSAVDSLISRFKQNGLLSQDVRTLTEKERDEIFRLWREGVVLFLECDMLKEKYGGFHQIDYKALPRQHSEAFFLAYATFITQYCACLNIYRMVGDNEFMETLLNEPAGEIPSGTYSHLKKLLLQPPLAIRANAGALYYELVKKDISFDKAVVEDFEERRAAFFKSFLKDPRIFIENPIDVLEKNAFDAWFPLQKQGALLMSRMRVTARDFLITPEKLAGVRGRLEPGDILLQRRNWCMTNIGIPGFWSHAALYTGSCAEQQAFFGDNFEKLKECAPDAFKKMQSQAEEGRSYAVIEAIKDGVILQSLETSAHCDCLAVIRPRISREKKLAVLCNAFSHFGKPYDMNFDFATDSELVCSELLYKAFNGVDNNLFAPEIVNGRLLLPPNLMAEQMIKSMKGSDSKFDFVLFLDCIESEVRLVEASRDEFLRSYMRPKWYVLR